ncbi:Uncharacterised protein [Mycoplasmopsis californica]|uniref:Lipoprotein 17-related variable surface protein n=1 Tax=Mycoplasmopsis equigenitalium TaxID=114883 RepID=A0ABY5J3G0_9BACT|nr:lipoprotein 17-related variable surface protein [Mycoplasmopsis equigenitalium]UUD36682.1 lipoprotein 17-related variable surface protein [Mycoplasmopsis equigenitalium]VEU69355.1 Uncharacterised protein [Mycoplasmopsis californica]
MTKKWWFLLTTSTALIPAISVTSCNNNHSEEGTISTEPNIDRALMQLINSETKNHKTLYPSMVDYKDINELDEDIKLSLNRIARNNHVKITIEKITPVDIDGLIHIKLNISRPDNSPYEIESRTKDITISGFKKKDKSTPLTLSDQESVDRAFDLVTNTRIKDDRRKYLASESKFAGYVAWVNEIELDLNTICQTYGVKIVTDREQPVNPDNNDNGIKTLNLIISKNKVSRKKTIEISNFVTNNEIKTKQKLEILTRFANYFRYPALEKEKNTRFASQIVGDVLVLDKLMDLVVIPQEGVISNAPKMSVMVEWLKQTFKEFENIQIAINETQPEPMAMDDLGLINFSLLFTLDGTQHSQTCAIRNVLTPKQAHNAAVTAAINGAAEDLNNLYNTPDSFSYDLSLKTKNHKNHYPSEVNYQNIDELAQDTGVDFGAIAKKHKVKITLSPYVPERSYDLDSLSEDYAMPNPSQYDQKTAYKLVSIDISAGSYDKNIICRVFDFKTKTYTPEEKENIKQVNKIITTIEEKFNKNNFDNSPTNAPSVLATTKLFKDTLPQDMIYTKDKFKEDFAVDLNVLEVQYGAQISFVAWKETPEIYSHQEFDEYKGWTRFGLKISKGIATKHIKFQVLGFVRRLDLFAEQFELSLSNGGEIVDGSYTGINPSGVKERDIVFKVHDDADPYFTNVEEHKKPIATVLEIIPDDANKTLTVVYYIMFEYQTSRPVTQTIKTYKS